MTKSENWGHYITNPNNALLQGKPPQKYHRFVLFDSQKNWKIYITIDYHRKTPLITIDYHRFHSLITIDLINPVVKKTLMTFPMAGYVQEPSPIAPAARCARSAPKRRVRKKVTAAAAPWGNGGVGWTDGREKIIWDSATQPNQTQVELHSPKRSQWVYPWK